MKKSFLELLNTSSKIDQVYNQQAIQQTAADDNNEVIDTILERLVDLEAQTGGGQDVTELTARVVALELGNESLWAQIGGMADTINLLYGQYNQLTIQIESLITTITPLTPAVNNLKGQSGLQFQIQIGDLPSQVETFSSKYSVVTGVTYTNVSSSTGRYLVQLDPTILQNYLGPGFLMISLSIRGLNVNPSSSDNDMNTPIYYAVSTTSFIVYLEEIGSAGQNIAIEGLIYIRP